MTAVCCPLCTHKVNIHKINEHIDSNCTSYLHESPSERKLKSQSDLTQYFQTDPPIKSRKRKREEIQNDNDDCKEMETPRKKVKFETFECKHESCISLESTDEIKLCDMKCMCFDQRIVGQKFCANKRFDLSQHELNPNLNMSGNAHLNLVHETDNPADENAIVIVRSIPKSSINGVGYLSRKISKIMVGLLRRDNVNIGVYSIPNGKDGLIQSVRIQICVSAELQNDDTFASEISNLREIIVANKGKNDLYFDILSDVLVCGQQKYSHLFEEIELKALEAMISLKGDDNTKDAIKLLSRLMLRKSKWFKIESLSYEEVADIRVCALSVRVLCIYESFASFACLKAAVSVLVEHGILIKSNQCGGMLFHECYTMTN